MSTFGFDSPPCDVLVFRAVPEAFEDEATRARLLSWLSDDERARHARFRFERDQQIYLVAHALVRHTLASLADVSREALSFVAQEHGRPEIAGPEPARALRFNLSHTPGLVVCAVSRGDAAIGVDVEHVDRRVEHLAVAQSVFSERELSGLHALRGEAQRERFFELWTLKESYIKAVGKGFALPLKEITFDPDAADPVPIHFGSRIPDSPERWQHHRFVPSERHRIAVCVEAPGPAIVRHAELGLADLLTA